MVVVVVRGIICLSRDFYLRSEMNGIKFLLLAARTKEKKEKKVFIGTTLNGRNGAHESCQQHLVLTCKRGLKLHVTSQLNKDHKCAGEIQLLDFS